MTFTSTPPTKPGFYAWKQNSESPIRAFNVTKWQNELFPLDWPRPVTEMGGQWCRLVPAEEVEKAFKEACDKAGIDYSFWNNSRAKKVMDGEI